MTGQQQHNWLKAGVVAARVIIGAVFVMSGLAKLIDLWGTVYKIEDYLHVWQIMQPRTVVFMAALALSGAEFILGALMLTGCCRRAVLVLLTALMAFMLPLSLYIYIADPVSDCGCFGDFWVISNAATFWKNVAIAAVLVFLLKNNRTVRPLFTPYSQWLEITILAAYALFVGLYGYNVQPMVDFRSFPVGKALLASDDDADRQPAVKFVYEKDGERREFSLDALPDSTWTFVDQVADGSPSGARTQLEVYDADGNDDTDEAVSAEGEQLILVIPSLARAEISWTYFLNELHAILDRKGASMVALIAGDDASIDAWKDLSMASYPVYTAEATTLKELARGNMALVLARDGRVVWKRSMAMIDTTTSDAVLAAEGNLDAFAPWNGPSLFRWLSLTLLAALVLLYILDSTGRLLSWRLRVRKMAGNTNSPTETASLK